MVWDKDPENMHELALRIRKMAEERPDNRYEPFVGDGSCFYDIGECTDGSVGCIFGQAWPSLTGYKPIFVLASNLPGTTKLLLWFQKVQEFQDRGRKWRDCIQYADQEVVL